MTVQQLRDELAKYPPNIRVAVFSHVAYLGTNGTIEYDDVLPHEIEEVDTSWFRKEENDTVCIEIVREKVVCR